MKLLTAPTEAFIKTELGRLASPATAGSSVAITVDNSDGIAAHDYVVIGFEGDEEAELCQVSSVTITTITVATLKFAHRADEPFTRYRYNQRKFYGSTSATGTFTELTSSGSPVTIQVDDPQGTSLEYTGSDGYTYFKATYYNSYTSEETDPDDADAVLADESARYCSIYGIRKAAGMANNPYYSDERIEQKRRQAENEINSTISAIYTLPLSEVPQLITYICETMASGYIEYEEFGADGNGGKKLGEARAILKAIAASKQRLIGSDGTELATYTTTSSLSGYPNDESTNAAKFTMDDRF